MKKSFLFIGLLVFLTANLFAQNLRPHFDANEARELLKVSIRQVDSTKYPYPDLLSGAPNYKLIYESPVVGIYNKWQFWLSPQNVAIISIQGTVAKKESWFQNFYSGMIAAEGELKIDGKTSFKYKLADDSNAYVHAGWMIGLASIAPDVLAKIKDYHNKGVNDFIILGHSQGGAIAFLLRSYLQYLDEPLPRNINIKTYGFATPKVGNQYYANDFDLINRGGWAFRIVNSEDWVPEMPFSIQKLDDINEVNPFSSSDIMIKKLPFGAKQYVGNAYKKMDKSTQKAQKTYTKYLGDKTYTLINDYLPNYEKPAFAHCFNYVSCGTTIILKPGSSYINNYLNKKESNIFIHHHIYPYYFLLMESFPERG